jgi:hypothetical protein
MLVRSEAIGLPDWLVTSAKAPPPSGSSPAGSLTLHAAGRSSVSRPSAVVKLFQDADAGAVPAALGEPAAVGVALAVIDVSEALGLGDVAAGGAACGPHAVSRKAKRHAAGTPGPDAGDVRITPSLGPDFLSFNCGATR